MIKSINYLNDGKVLLNDAVILFFDDKLRVHFNRELISENDAACLAKIYLGKVNDLVKKLG